MSKSKPSHTLNAIGHFDVAGPDLERLGHFYSSVFGWKVEPKGPGYAMLETPEGTPRGAFVEDDEPSLTIGIVVGDLDRALEIAAAAGGAIVMPKMDNGWVKKARISDPAGNFVTVIQA